jgi:(1->4)-alpha-D-glucan 1-alpha-D-glucosylmutase
VFAFARTHGTQSVVVAVPRLPATLLPDGDTAPIGEAVWGDTTIDAPREGPSSYRHVLTGATVCACDKNGRPAIRAADLFAAFPVAFVEAV